MAKILMPALFLVLVAFSASSAQMIYNSSMENEGVDCPVTLPGAFTTANAYLPDPFLKLNGNRMTTKEEWMCRRQEIFKLMERTVYGTKPPKPATVTGTVTKNGNKATVTVNVTDNNVSKSFTVDVTLPTTGTAPYPLLLRMENSGASDATMRGWGVATAGAPLVAPETGSRTSKTGLFYDIYGSTSKTGILAAQAWGVSRVIDVIQASDGKILKWDAVAVTGCSREGKKAFVAGALDQRVALTIPMESGSGGMNIMRGAYKDKGAQSPSSAYTEKWWLGDDFSAFTNNPNNLPVDMHEAVALVAPRGLFVMDKTAASAGEWLNIPSSHAAAKAGAEVYKALGVGGNIHYMNTPTQAHCSGQASYDTQLKDFVDKFLLRAKEPGTTPLFTENNPPTMTTWVNWTTPTLSGTYTPSGACEGFKVSASASPVAGGTVTASPAGNCHENGAKVTLTATPKAGWIFDGWEGDANGTTTTAEVTMNANKTATAKFKIDGCPEYQATLCGGADYGDVLDDTNEMPATGKCVFIKDFTQIEPSENSTVAVNGTKKVCTTGWAENGTGDCGPVTKPAAKVDGGYYIYVEKGTINTYTPTGATEANGWKGIVKGAREISACGSTPVVVKPMAFNFSMQVLNNKEIRIESSSANVLEIFNLKGNKVASIQILAGSQTVKLALPAGIYLSKVRGMQTNQFMLK